MSRSTCRIVGFLTWVAVGIAPVTTQGADSQWFQFRGPTGDGKVAEANLPVKWSDSQQVTWSQPLTGEGWSSPVVDRNQIYLTAAVPAAGGKPGYSLRLLSFDANGKPGLNVEVFPEDGQTRIHSKNSHASPTPLIDADRIYVHFGHEGTACLDLQGKILWQNRSLRYAPVHGAGATPILFEGRLIFSCDGAASPEIVALDAQTGSISWRTARVSDADKKFSFATATLIHVDGQPQVISPGSNMVCGLDPRSGQEIWRVRYDGYSVIPKPVLGHHLYICTGYNTPNLLAIRTGGKGDVTDSHVAWTVKRAVPHTPSLIVDGELLFMVSDNGIASCLDAKTGETIWQQRLGGNYSASPILANGNLYFLNEAGTTFVVKAAREYQVVAENTLPERTLASFGVLGDSLLVRGDKHLYRLGTR